MPTTSKKKSNPWVQQLASIKEFFDRSTRELSEEDSAFAPAPGMYTAAQQVAHAAQTVDWFLDGAFAKAGFSMDFEGLDKEVRKVSSLKKARLAWDKSIRRAQEIVAKKTAKQMEASLPPGPIMGGEPRSHVFSALADHTAHHRGALTVYQRLLKKIPAMPYMDM